MLSLGLSGGRVCCPSAYNLVFLILQCIFNEDGVAKVKACGANSGSFVSVMPWNYRKVYSESYVEPGAVDLFGIFPGPTVMFLLGTGGPYSAITTRHQVELKEETTISF